MKVVEIAFSGYPVTDLKRARAFYEGVLGLTVEHAWEFGDGRGWIEYAIAGGTLAVACVSPDWKPSRDGCTVALEVEDFPAAVAELKAAGVPFGMEPTETPVCWMAGVYDPDGNPVTLHRRKAPPAAA